MIVGVFPRNPPTIIVFVLPIMDSSIARRGAIAFPFRGIERPENSPVDCFQWFERPEKCPVDIFQWFERPEICPVDRF